jgi:tol-pal system protein YbgF
MNTKILFSLFCLAIVIFSGCVPLNQDNITDLKGTVAQLQIECKELKENNGRLNKDVDSLVNSVKSLNTLVQGLQSKVSFLNQNEKDLTHSSDNNLNGNKQVPSVLAASVYQSAYSDYSIGKYELAYSGFKSFIEKYPNTELAPQAQFYLGECFYSRKMWEDAIKEYQKVEELYNRSDQIISAKLKIALCYENLGKKQEALKLFSLIVENFPKRPESLTAKEKIKAYI